MIVDHRSAAALPVRDVQIGPVAPGASLRSSVRTVCKLEDVALLFEGDVNVVIQRTAADPRRTHEAELLVHKPELLLQRAVAADDVRRMLGDHFRDCPHLAEEVGDRSEILADLTGCPTIGVRLARVERGMCPRFHVDQVTVRAVVTFIGYGTEVIGDPFVDRSHLGHASKGKTDEGSGLLRVGAVIERAEPFDVVWLKGESWPGNGGRGAVHRSPSASPSCPRLVLTLDALG